MEARTQHSKEMLLFPCEIHFYISSDEWVKENIVCTHNVVPLINDVAIHKGLVDVNKASMH